LSDAREAEASTSGFARLGVVRSSEEATV